MALIWILILLHMDRYIYLFMLGRAMLPHDELLLYFHCTNKFLAVRQILHQCGATEYK